MNTWQLIIPMAGRGQRFIDAGYGKPKPLIDVVGQPMVRRVIDNVSFGVAHCDIHLIVQKEHVSQVRDEFSDGYHNIHVLDKVTDGAARTISLIMDKIDPDRPLLIANSDQWLDWSNAHFVDYCDRSSAYGVIPTFKASGPKWSYAYVLENGVITNVAEKLQISDRATCGIYWFRRAYFCFEAIAKMIKAERKTNGEFYLAPAFNEMIHDGLEVIEYPVPVMHGMGTPQDLQNTISSGIFAGEEL